MFHRVLLIVSLLACQPALAGVYRYEIEADTGTQETDFSDTQALGVVARYYFKGVDDTKGPLAEASFVTRASSLSITYTDTETDFDAPSLAAPQGVPVFNFAPNPALLNPPPAGVAAVSVADLQTGARGDAYSARVSHFFARHWLASAQVSKSDSTSQQFFSRSDGDANAYAVQIGRYIRDLTTVTVGFSYSDQDQSTLGPVLTCPAAGFCSSPYATVLATNSRQRSWRTSVRHLQPLGQMHYAIEGTVAYDTTSFSRLIPAGSPNPLPIVAPEPDLDLDGWLVNGVYTLYPRQNWGVGFDLAHSDVQGSSVNAYALHTQWFWKPAVALTGRIERTNGSGFGGDADGFRIGLTGRF